MKQNSFFPQHLSHYLLSKTGLCLSLIGLGACDSTLAEDTPQAAGGAALSYFGPALPDLQGNRPSEQAQVDNPWQRPNPSHHPLTTAPQQETDSAEEAPLREPAGLLLTLYYESRGAEKYLEIQHVSGDASEEGSCVLEVYANGNMRPFRRVVLPPLQPQERVLLCTTQAQDAACLPLLGSTIFNGNDALLISCQGELTDSFGRLGEDPGSAWTEGEISSKDQRLIRCDLTPARSPQDEFLIAQSWGLWHQDEPREEAERRCSPSPGDRDLHLNCLENPN